MLGSGNARIYASVVPSKARNSDWLRAPCTIFNNPKDRQGKYYVCGACPESGSAGRALQSVSARDVRRTVHGQVGRWALKVSDKLVTSVHA